MENINSNSGEFFTAHRMPWSLRDFMVYYGGVDGHQKEVWDKTLAKTYMMNILHRKTPPGTMKCSKRDCQDDFLYKAFTAGFIDREPRQHTQKTPVAVTGCNKSGGMTTEVNNYMRIYKNVGTLASRVQIGDSSRLVPTIRQEIQQTQMWSVPYENAKMLPLRTQSQTQHVTYSPTIVDICTARSASATQLKSNIFNTPACKDLMSTDSQVNLNHTKSHFPNPSRGPTQTKDSSYIEIDANVSQIAIANNNGMLTGAQDISQSSQVDAKLSCSDITASPSETTFHDDTSKQDTGLMSSFGRWIGRIHVSSNETAAMPLKK